MERIDLIFKVAAAGLGGFLSFWFGGWDLAIQTLIIFIVTDYITGMIASVKDGWSSKVGLKGICKKIMILILVGLCYQLDLLFGNETPFIKDAATMFFLWNELLSITENVGRTGVPLPPVIKNAIQILKNKGGSENV